MAQIAGENCHGFTSWLSPQCGVKSRELSKSPLFPGAAGGGGGGSGYK